MSQDWQTSQQRPRKGLFVAIEGIDGAGKTTMAQLLVQKLKKLVSQDIILTSEPTKGKIGKLLREYLRMDQAQKEVDALLFAADRVEHFHTEILPNLEQGNIVITDRYVYSSYAYQSTQGLPLDWLQEINKFVPLPDVVFLLDIPVTTAFERLKNQNRDENEKFEKVVFLKEVKKVYDQFTKESNVRVVDADRSSTEILNDLTRYILDMI
ncbi:MAG: dTMP kinase [Methanobacteriota archaeon]|nr:MAG: dTMP kinase [Euryarchaeota archaeon]